MDALKALSHGFTFEEIVNNIDNLETLYKKAENESQVEKENHCSKCNIELKNIDEIFICAECGEVGDCEMINEWVDNIWLERSQCL